MKKKNIQIRFYILLYGKSKISPIKEEEKNHKLIEIKIRIIAYLYFFMGKIISDSKVILTDDWGVAICNDAKKEWLKVSYF